MRPLLVLIHGIRFEHPPAEALLRLTAALERGFPDLSQHCDIKLLHWAGAAGTFPDPPLAQFIRRAGDKLADFILQVKAHVAEGPVSGEFDQDLPADALPTRAIAKALASALVQSGRALVENAIDDGVLPLEGAERPTLVETTTSAWARAMSELYFDEVHAYMFEPGRRAEIRGLCGQQFDALFGDTPRPVAVCAHSLGSLIAHDGLLERARTGTPVPIDLLITLGSPLGFPAVLTRLGDCGHLAPGVKRWVNVAARHDLVAAVPALSPLICPEDPEGPGIEDYLIDNPRGSWSWPESFHDPEGYLESEPVAEALRQWLGVPVPAVQGS